MAKHKHSVPHYTAIEWARLKQRNGYALTPTERFLLGIKG